MPWRRPGVSGYESGVNQLDFSKMRIMVTGGAGFLGGYVIEALKRRGAESIFVPRIEDYDLVDRASVRRLMADAKPDLVFHLAAQVGGIGANRANPGLYAFANAMMGLHVFEECRLAAVKKLVAVGTICAYPKFTPVPFKEDDLWNGYPEETNAPYGIAKKMMLVLSQGYREQYQMNSVVLFPVNLYGPRDNFDPKSSHVIPALIRKCVEARDAGRDEIVLWGDGTPTREFLYAADAAEGLVLAAERYDASDPVNLGTGMEIAIRELATLIAEQTGFKGRLRWDKSQPNGQPRRRLDVTRARERFGFVAQTKFADGLRATIDYFEDQHRKGAL
jgi:GDP-L-fucose synthase